MRQLGLKKVKAGRELLVEPGRWSTDTSPSLLHDPMFLEASSLPETFHGNSSR